MNSIETPLRRAEKAISEAEYILIGAGAGLSTAAGIHYDGPCFQEAFKDMIERYGFTDLYTSSFYPFASEEEKWAYWSRHIVYARFAPEGLPLYKKLLKMVQGKEYFVITTNVDGQFIKAGFPAEKVFEVQGDYGLMQCATACHPKRYSNESLVRQMVARQHDCHIPFDLVPHCPVCGGPMKVNLRADDTFVEDEGWHAAAKRYVDFINNHQKGKILYWDLGIGSNTPTIIKLPFMQMTYKNPEATYATINLEEAFTVEQIEDRSIVINGDIGEVLDELLKNIDYEPS